MALDADDIKKINELLSSGLKTALDARDQDIAGLIKKHLDPVNREIESLKSKGVAAGDDDDDADSGKAKGKGRGKDSDPEVAREVARLRKMVEDRDKELQTRQQAERRSKLESAARNELLMRGVPAERVDVALAYLRDRLAYEGDTDKMGLANKDKYGNDVLEPLGDALGSFLGTTEGKIFLPPSGGQGTGEAAGGAPPPTTKEGKFDWDSAARNLNLKPLMGG